MSITPALKAAARSAYRNLWRASSSTFAGDGTTLAAWRTKMRADARSAEADTDPSAYEGRTVLAREIADVLAKNVVQARREEADRWQLRVTKTTELGDNESIKNPIPVPPRRRRGKEGEVNPCGVRTFSTSAPCARDPSVSSTPAEDEPDKPSSPSLDEATSKRLNYSKLKRAHKHRVLPELREEDLEESFVRGHGPGGQSINKTNNNVQIIHKPSGIRVACQETRSLDLNRRYARKILLDKLDQIANPGLSKTEMRAARQNERERRKRKKARKKASAMTGDEAEEDESDLQADSDANKDEAIIESDGALEKMPLWQRRAAGL